MVAITGTLRAKIIYIVPDRPPPQIIRVRHGRQARTSIRQSSARAKRRIAAVMRFPAEKRTSPPSLAQKAYYADRLMRLIHLRGAGSSGRPDAAILARRREETAGPASAPAKVMVLNTYGIWRFHCTIEPPVLASGESVKLKYAWLNQKTPGPARGLDAVPISTTASGTAGR